MHQKQNPAGFYTKGEEIFNAVSHGAGSVLAIGGTGALVALAAALANWRTVLICLVYGLSLVVLYTMSTLYHAFPFEGVKRLFRVFDHSSIYLLIAGSYTPFTLILLDGTWKGPPFWASRSMPSVWSGLKSSPCCCTSPWDGPLYLQWGMWYAHCRPPDSGFCCWEA